MVCVHESTHGLFPPFEPPPYLQVEMHALKTVSAPLAALIYTAEPLWGALFAWVLLSERWGPTGWAGAALIVASTAASQVVNSRNKAKQA